MSSWNSPNATSVDEFNPFAAPQHQHLEADSADSNDEIMRRTYLSHESSVKSIGICFLFLGAAAFSITIAAAVAQGKSDYPLHQLLIWIVVPIVSGTCLATGYGLHQLRGWSRIP